MKSFINALGNFFYEVGRIRAAMELSRLGRHEEAKYLINKG